MAKNEALSEFLTGKRAAVTPAQVGLSATGPRRVPGLRREEVAFLAGVSVDWYIRLEQGRQVTPSESVLAAIAKILLLDDAEHDYLVNLARPAAGITGGPAEVPVRPGIVKMLRTFDRQAAFVVGPRTEVLAGNDLAWALLTDFPSRAPGDRNLLRWILLDPDARKLYADWAVVASEMVGVLQLEASSYPNDEAMAAFVGELATKSPEFRTWWSVPNPLGRTSGRERFLHPPSGRFSSTGKRSWFPAPKGRRCSSTVPRMQPPKSPCACSPRGGQPRPSRARSADPRSRQPSQDRLGSRSSNETSPAAPNVQFAHLDGFQ